MIDVYTQHHDDLKRRFEDARAADIAREDFYRTRSIPGPIREDALEGAGVIWLLQPTPLQVILSHIFPGRRQVVSLLRRDSVSINLMDESDTSTTCFLST